MWGQTYVSALSISFPCSAWERIPSLFHVTTTTTFVGAETQCIASLQFILRSMFSITSKFLIPLSELSFTFSRSSGPGGQHVNKVNSRVTLWFDLWNSPNLTEGQKKRLSEKLAGRINQQGRLRLVGDRHRTQMANRQDVILRFYDLLREALKTNRRRKKTKVGKAATERRLSIKKKRGRLKKERGRRPINDC